MRFTAAHNADSISMSIVAIIAVAVAAAVLRVWSVAGVGNATSSNDWRERVGEHLLTHAAGGALPRDHHSHQHTRNKGGGNADASRSACEVFLPRHAKLEHSISALS